MDNKINGMVQEDIEAGRIKLVIKDRCFICGEKIESGVDPVVRYSKQGNTCNDCSTCSGLSRSIAPKKVERYKRWCLKLDSLQNK